MSFFKKEPADLNLDTAMAALRSVREPELDQDLLSLGFIKDLKIDKGKVHLWIELSSPVPEVREEVRQQSESVIRALPGVRDVQVEVTFKVSSNKLDPARQLIPQVKNAIAVASGKGGVGKSTVATNLATALHSYGAKVGLMDADVYGPSIPILMGAREQPKMTDSKRIVPPVMRGIKLISMGYFLPRDEAVIWRGPMLHKMIQDFLGVVEWGELDYLVIDLPPGTGDVQLSLCQTIPLTGAVIISTPQDLALEVASKAIAMFQKLKTPVLGIVENMSYYSCSHCGQRDDIFGHGGARKASENLGFPFLGDIPLSTSIRKRSDQGEPVALDRDTPGGKAYAEIAARVANQINLANLREQTAISIEQ